MRDYKIYETTKEVWCEIKKAHNDNLCVFSSYSAPDGDYFGNPSQGKMFTSYGFKCCDFPVMEAETTWDIDRQNPNERNNEKHIYCIFCGK